MKLHLACCAALLPLAAAGAQPATRTDTLSTGIVQSLLKECAGPRQGEEIVVCGQRDEQEQFRLPLVRNQRFDPNGPVNSVSRERNRLLGEHGSTLGSCSNVGPNGMTGCLNQGVWARREQSGE